MTVSYFFQSYEIHLALLDSELHYSQIHETHDNTFDFYIAQPLVNPDPSPLPGEIFSKYIQINTRL